MLIRISLIIAILAALAIGGLNFVKVKEKITTLKADRDNWQSKFTATDAELTKTKAERQNQQILSRPKTRWNSPPPNAIKPSRKLPCNSRRPPSLPEVDQNHPGTRRAQANLQRYKVTGFEPERILAFGKQLKDLKTPWKSRLRKRILSQSSPRPQPNWRCTNQIGPPPLPANLKGKILVVDPRWEFVLVDVGKTKE
jgi:hypothetical protein